MLRPRCGQHNPYSHNLPVPDKFLRSETKRRPPVTDCAHACPDGFSSNETRPDLIVSYLILLQPKNKMHLKLERLVTGEELYPRRVQQETWGREGRQRIHTQ